MANVRIALQKDLPALQALDSWPSAQVWQQKIDAQEVIVLEADGQLSGLMRFTRLWTTVPFLGLVWLEPACRGQGYSRQMLEFLTTHLKQSGAVALLSSSQTNEPTAQAWHVHMGFHTNGVIENIADNNIGEIVYRLML